MNMKKIVAVIYDNDGLLTDSEIVYGRTLTQLMQMNNMYHH